MKTHMKPLDTNSDYSVYSDTNSYDNKNDRPYWNFWKVVFAGWLIKYPGKIFSGIFWCLLLLSMGIAYMVSPSDYQNVIEQSRMSSEEQTDTPPTYRK